MSEAARQQALSVIEKDLAKRLPGSDPDTRAALSRYAYDRNMVVTREFGKLEYSPDLFDACPRLFKIPTVESHASHREKAEVAMRLEKWLRAGDSIDLRPLQAPRDEQGRFSDDASASPLYPSDTPYAQMSSLQKAHAATDLEKHIEALLNPKEGQ